MAFPDTYQLLRFAHVGATFLFMLAHGVSAAIMFRLKREQDPHTIRTLLDLSGATLMPVRMSMLAMLLSGLATAWAGGLLTALWGWAAFGVFIVVMVPMGLLGLMKFNALRKAAGCRFEEGRGWHAPLAPVADDDLRAMVRTLQPELVTGVSLVGFFAIVWLMTFKPI